MKGGGDSRSENGRRDRPHGVQRSGRNNLKHKEERKRKKGKRKPGQDTWGTRSGPPAREQNKTDRGRGRKKGSEEGLGGFIHSFDY